MSEPNLTADEQAMAKQFDMTADEYAAYKGPNYQETAAALVERQAENAETERLKTAIREVLDEREAATS